MPSSCRRRSRRLLTPLLLIPALLSAGLACPGAPRVKDTEAPGRAWPLFGGTPSRNMVNTVEKNIPSSWSIQEGERKNIKWAVPLGSVSYGGPVIAGGKVFVGTNNKNPRNPKITGDKGVLMCFRASDGQFFWQAVHDKLPDTHANDWPEQGVASTPVIDGNRLYYVSNRGELICADVEGVPETKEAKIIWRLDMVSKLGVYPRYLANCAPLVAGELVFAVTGNGVNREYEVVNPKAPSFIAVDKKTGEVRWQDNSPGDKIMDGQWGNPTYAEINGKPQIIFPGGDGWLYAFEPATGKLIWKFDCNPKKSEFKPGGRGTRSYLLATPVVYQNKVYVGIGQDPQETVGIGHFWCIDITKTGDLSPANDDFDPKAEVNKNSGLVWHFGGPVVPKPKLLGRESHFGRTISTAAIHDGLVYIADLPGYVYCLDARTGQKHWDYDVKASIWGSPYYVDGKVFIGTDDREMYVFPHGKTKPDRKVIEKSKIDMESPIKTAPVAVNGVLYVMTDTHLYAIAEK